jgi:hypothetical protein
LGYVSQPATHTRIGKRVYDSSVELVYDRFRRALGGIEPKLRNWRSAVSITCDERADDRKVHGGSGS